MFQMLSMRNGTSLHPMVLPGLLQPLQLSQVRTGFDEETGYKHLNLTTSVPLDGEAWLQTMFTSSNQAHFSPFPFRVSAEEIWRKDILPRLPLNVRRAERNPSELELAAAATTSLPFGIRACELKARISFEACVTGRDQSE
ncbi:TRANSCRIPTION FACTOR SPATULA [Salix koriyanagi]|uniref:TRANSCRIPTION FACTOR SPATULA n=1 Tax=Salix koriyanagi TaxID=2511006 RepID=A0A9Q0P5J6_9ROSI|nr:TRANSCRIPTION FACTOR SPATULA [Salix koriyanagi]